MDQNQTQDKPTKKGRKGPDYPPELKIKAALLFATGVNMVQIADIIQVKDSRVIERWKAQKFPMDWDKLREDTRATTVELRAKNLPMITTAQDIMMTRMTEALTNQIVSRAEIKMVDDGIAAKLIMDLFKEQRKLHLPLEKQFDHLNRGSSTFSMGMGAQSNPQTGQSNLMVMLNQRYDELNGNEDDDATTSDTTTKA